MPLEIRERDLPGVGVRYEADLSAEETVAVLIHNTGRRDLYYRDGDETVDFEHVVELTDSQARALGLLLVGAYYQPVPAQAGEVTPTDEHTKWYQVAEDAPAVGESLGDLGIGVETDAVVLAIIRRGDRTTHPSDDFVLQVDDHLVAIGDQTAHQKLGELIHGTQPQ